MRILKIRFKNLNSLIGEWEIDLTHPAFASDGIFAITGPTGAGKTTILDAICLALYGRTPRLNRIGKSGNEIMSRQTGECFAEVEFETQSGHFRCHWSQHRSRKKPDGDLQNPKHEIADADSGIIIEAKLRGVAEKIEQATGMDFDRFTRSMLLAQGGFAAFLQAAPDDRAPILEQITGTEIYSRISIRVHEKRSDERKKLDALQSELAGMQLLSEEEEQQLRLSQTQKSIEEADLSKQVEQINQEITWLDNISQLEKELSLLEEQKQTFITRQDEFKLDLDRLNRAKQALELAGDYAGLTSIRGEQEADRKDLDECQRLLPEQEVNVQTAESTLKPAIEDLKAKRVEQKQTLAVIQKVRELDFKSREKESAIKKITDKIAEMKKSLDAAQSQKTEGRRNLELKKIDQEKATIVLNVSSADEGLIEHLAGIRNRFDSLRELDSVIRNKQKELSVAEKQKVEAAQECSDQLKRLETQKNEFSDMQGKLEKHQVELKNTLDSQTISDWRNALTELKERKILLEKVSASIQSLAQLRRTLNDLTTRYSTLTMEQSSLKKKVEDQTEKHAGLEREMHLLETQLSLLKKIKDFDEARHQLKDGELCPLCGAKDHPFAEGNIPVPDEATTALIRVRADLKHTNDTLSSFKIKLAETLKDLDQIVTRQNEIGNQVKTEELQIQDGLLVLSVVGLDEDRGDISAGVLLRLQQQNEDKLVHALQVVLAIDEYEKKIGSLRESLEKTRDAVIQLELNTQTATHKKETTEQTVERVQKELEVLANQCQLAEQEALRDVAPYGVKSLLIDALDEIQCMLTSRRDQRLSLKDQLTDLEKKIATLEIQTQYQAEQISKSVVELKQQQDQLNVLQHERQSLIQERHALFLDKNPDDEESRLSLLIDKAEKHLEKSQQAFNTATQELSNTKNRTELIKRTMLVRADKLKTEEAAFNTRLAALSFSDEANYLAARLSEDERKSLMQQEQQLITAQTALNTRYQDKVTLLKTERQKKVTEQPREPLAQMLVNHVNKLKELRQELGAIQQKLTDNERLRQRQQQRTKAIDAQKKECSRWDVLHELIGSADGKKYRNFAQGLTFEMMIGHANRQLQKMTDRYLLIRDDAQPLELNVVDNYQAGEVRSTKNLSGGEGFIVSLSLALGLSHMASKNVRVDSLFLDEGFGTLDEEALDTALETLAGLQQDGKLIGVISHVPTLKERIGTQIQVNPHAGGRSEISGPGCSGL